MSGADAGAGAVQVAALALAPLLTGTIQSIKAGLQGRRGASPLQPYRALRRLWSKSVVDPQGTTAIYRLAPAVVAASLVLAIAAVPIAGHAPDWAVGHDAFVLVGLLALARFAATAASWDTGSGFALMGAARDLMLAVFGEALLVLALLLAALPARSTDLAAMHGALATSGAWATPAPWCGLVAFAIVVLVETGRQPIDNPDTHLELTMIHEAPLLEYGGRDLAYLQWAAAARHWVLLVLVASLLLPRTGGFAAQLGLLAATLAGLCVAVAVGESVQAKMRVLRVPALIGLGCLAALAGIASFAGGVGT
ncbi:MAG: respiratory chain complex I subunit 1 family protein [Thermoleophilia bacterium]